MESNGFEIFERELFGAGIRRNAGIFEQLRNGSFWDAEVFRDAVENSFAAHGESGFNYLEEGIPRARGNNGGRMDINADDGGIYVWSRHKAAARNVEKDFWFPPISDGKADGSGIAGTGSGADTGSSFLLEHEGERGYLKLRFKQVHNNGGGYVVGEICANYDVVAGEMLLNESGEICFESIGINDGDVIKVGESFVEDLNKSGVQLNADDFFTDGSELAGEDSHTGTYLDDAGRLVGAAVLSHLRTNGGIDEKILTEAF